MNFVDYVIKLIKNLMAPIMTAAAVVVFVIIALDGTLGVERTWWIILGVFAFWMGDRFINKYIAPPKVNGQVVTPSTPVVSSDGLVSTNGETEEDTYDPQYDTPPEPIPFDPVAFKNDVDAKVLGDYTVVNPSTTFYEARDKTYYRTNANNNVAHKDLVETILDYAKKAMAYQWANVLGKTPTDEFNANPIKYVNDHFADFRNCPSCKQPMADQLVDIKWLSGNLGEATRVSYYDVLNAQKAYDSADLSVKINGLMSWEV